MLPARPWSATCHTVCLCHSWHPCQIARPSQSTKYWEKPRHCAFYPVKRSYKGVSFYHELSAVWNWWNQLALDRLWRLKNFKRNKSENKSFLVPAWCTCLLTISHSNLCSVLGTLHALEILLAHRNLQFPSSSWGCMHRIDLEQRENIHPPASSPLPSLCVWNVSQRTETMWSSNVFIVFGIPVMDDYGMNKSPIDTSNGQGELLL